MERILEPELLDVLSPDDPRALRSRRDLRRINFWLGNVGTLARTLERSVPRPPKVIADIGAGDASISLQLAQRLSPRWKNLELLLVDRQNNIPSETLSKIEATGWRPRIVAADIFEWLEANGEYDVIFANLFLHHFTEDQLKQLFQKASRRTSVFIGCEPRRYRFASLINLMLCLIGCSAVTRNDAIISVRAGFRGHELSKFWPDDPQWKVSEQRAGLFSHSLVATRRS